MSYNKSANEIRKYVYPQLTVFTLIVSTELKQLSDFARFIQQHYNV